MELTATTMISLDGVTQAPGGPDEDTSGGFDLGGWVMPYFEDEGAKSVRENFERADAFLLGRKTYEIFADYWPHADPANPIGTTLNSLPKHVVSTTLTDLSWSGASLVEGDPIEAIAELKRQPGRELQVHGSVILTQSLLAAGLIHRRPTPHLRPRRRPGHRFLRGRPRARERPDHPLRSGSDVVEAWDLVDRELAVDPFQILEVEAILAAAREALEADDAAQGGKWRPLATPVEHDRVAGDGVVVEGRQTTTQDVDDPVTAADPQMLGSDDVTRREPPTIAQAGAIDPLEEAVDGFVGLRPVGHEEVGVPGGTQVTVGDDAEATDHHVWQADRVRVGDHPV
jgi:dihydrofolate reductase